jgi:hypothetical protein
MHQETDMASNQEQGQGKGVQAQESQENDPTVQQDQLDPVSQLNPQGQQQQSTDESRQQGSEVNKGVNQGSRRQSDQSQPDDKV